MLGFRRLLTNQQVMGESTTTSAEALQLYDRWTEDPRVELSAEPRGAGPLTFCYRVNRITPSRIRVQ
jgi:hypothetical protein